MPGATVGDDVVYEQLCADFRSLNGFLWQMPVLVMTLTVGLWFAVASIGLTPAARSDLLDFAGMADLLMIVALFRLRIVMSRVQARIRTLDGGEAHKVNYVIVVVFSILLACASFGSFRAARSPGEYFGSPAAKGVLVASAGQTRG